ncbi:hypothetical protein ACXM1Q_005525 [Streptococcus sp. 10F2]
MLYFPGISQLEFDFEERWLVRSVDLAANRIHFEGRGQNQDLEFVLEYSDQAELLLDYEVGDLIHLPKELFIQPEVEPYEVEYECF